MGKGMAGNRPAAGKSNGSASGRMPRSNTPGGANTGTFHGQHNVAHPLQGGSDATNIAKAGNGRNS